MKKNETQSLFGGIVMAIVIWCSTASNVYAQLVTNGSFESSNTAVVTGTDVKGWFIQVASGVTPAPVFEIVSDIVEQGNRALKVTVHGLGVNDWDIQIVADSIHVIPGVTYNYSIWARCEKGSATVNFTVGNYSYSEYGAIRPANLGTRWQSFTMQFTVSDNQTVIRAPIHFYGAADTGNSIYIDNLQIVDPNAGKRPVIVDAESGKPGSHFRVLQDGNVTYVSTDTTWTNLYSPGDTSRVITYQVPFADSGTYNLFARVRVDSNSGSFFYGNGFGWKSDTLSSDWVAVDGLAIGGFSDSVAVVDGPGTLGSGVWKWINLTKNAYQGAKGNPFVVSIDSLTRTLQIGGRNEGLDIDKFAFGKAGLYYTVGELNYGLPGTTRNPADSSLFWKGPALAAGQTKFLGNAYGDFPDSNFAKYWTQLTPGNAGKFGSVAVSTDTSQWNWNGLNTAYNYAIDNHLIFKDHNLIWGQQQPSWISSLDSAQQASYIEIWFRNVGQRYPKIDMVDVVNEPLNGHNPPDGGGTPARANYKNALGGNGTTGWDWVINSFKLARKYLPNAKLLINDYGIINDNTATTSYLQVISLLYQQGLIDGIGVQGHRFELEGADTSTLKSNLDRLAATGLPIYISELDLGNLSDYGTPNDNQQLQLYVKIFPVLWRHPGVKGITLWGYLEGQMWQTTCYLVRSDGTARPALLWLAEYVKNNPVGVTETASRLPSAYQLEQNFPNPFNPSTTLRYGLPTRSRVRLQVYNVLGQLVAELTNAEQAAGWNQVVWNAKVASGLYFYRFEAVSISDPAKRFVDVKKMILLK